MWRWQCSRSKYLGTLVAGVIAVGEWTLVGMVGVDHDRMPTQAAASSKSRVAVLTFERSLFSATTVGILGENDKKVSHFWYRGGFILLILLRNGEISTVTPLIKYRHSSSLKTSGGGSISSKCCSSTDLTRKKSEIRSYNKKDRERLQHYSRFVWAYKLR